MQSKVYFNNTNRHRVGNQYIEQLVDNRNRTEFASLEGSFLDLDFDTGESNDGETMELD